MNQKTGAVGILNDSAPLKTALAQSLWRSRIKPAIEEHDFLHLTFGAQPEDRTSAWVKKNRNAATMLFMVGAVTPRSRCST